MKIAKLMLTFAAAAAALNACQKENGSISPESGDYNTSFLSVSLKSAGTMTKAPEDTFEYGLDAENDVTTVNFYFFDAAGSAYSLYDANTNWLAVNTSELSETDSEGTTEEGTDIEAYTDVILVLKSREVTPPSKVVALINVENGADYENKSLTDLTALANKALTVDGKGFVMSNSVYEDGSIVKATEITAENIFTSPVPSDNEGAVLAEDSNLRTEIENGNIKPVEIYVERVAAKVRVNSSVAHATTGLIKVTPSEASPLPATLTEAYVKVLGWQVTNTVETSYLIKDVKETNLITTWNNAAFFRSYWANTHADAAAIHGLTFNAIAPKEGALALGAHSYYHENTLDPEVKNVYNNVDVDGTDEKQAVQAPQLIVAAQLVDVAGNPLNIAKWYGTFYTEEDVKTAMINTVAAKIFVADESSTEDTPVYRSINSKDVTWYQVDDNTSYGETSDADYTGNRRYEVKVKATEETKYYDATGTELTTANDLLDGIQAAQIWKDGYTYYYTTIDHFGATAMVRNHLYDVNIEAITGLGTPVYDTTQIITPEIPVDQEAYHLTAKINILTWHLVSQDVTLGF